MNSLEFEATRPIDVRVLYADRRDVRSDPTAINENMMEAACQEVDRAAFLRIPASWHERNTRCQRVEVRCRDATTLDSNIRTVSLAVPLHRYSRGT